MQHEDANESITGDELAFWGELAESVASERNSAGNAEAEAGSSAAVPGRCRIERGVRQIWQVRVPLSRPSDVDAAWRTFQRQMATRNMGGPAVHVQNSGPRQIWKRWAMLATGTAIAAATIGGVIVTLGGSSSQPRSAHVYHTRPGQRATLHLASGVKIILAPATTIRVENERIDLGGEASFTVPPHAGQSFTVRMPDATVRVLGTTFTARQYATDQGSAVVVADGKVELRVRAKARFPDARAVLTQGMRGEVAGARIVATQLADLDAHLGWVRGQLAFKRVRLDTVVAELSRAYGVDIRIRDSALARQAVTLKASVDSQPVTEILEFIGRVVDAHYVRNDRGFVLAAGRPNQYPPSKTFPQPERQYGK